MSEASSLCTAYLVPSCDAHNSEYLAERDKRRAFITGFTGSAGTAIVTRDMGYLWTDGRYHLQAAREIDHNWKLMKVGATAESNQCTHAQVCPSIRGFYLQEGLPETPTRGEWLLDNLKTGDVVGVDPCLITQAEWSRLHQKIHHAGIR